MTVFLPLNRRRWLAGSAAALAWPALAQPRGASSRAIAVAQIVDATAASQDVSKDFLIGSRAAWQDINTRGGVHGRPVRHATFETDGSAASVRAAVQAALALPDCVALSGTVGDAVALQVAQLLEADPAPIAHAAPWLQNSTVAAVDRTFPIFAGRQEQVAHALRSLALVGVQELGVVYASARELALYREDMTRAAAAMKLRLTAYQGNGDLTPLGQRLGPKSPALLLFVGGTPELVQFTQGLDRQNRQRYVIALADVNLQTVAQLGAGRATPIIATQPVPLVTAALPIVRSYRDVLARLFDEPPVALSLAGFIGARYTYEVLQQVEGQPSRASVLAAFARRQPLDLGGYPVSFDAQRRSAGYVTQALLTSDGRLIG